MTPGPTKPKETPGPRQPKQRPGPGRPKKRHKGLKIFGVAGGLVLVLIVAVAVGGSTVRPAAHTVAKPAAVQVAPKPVTKPKPKPKPVVHPAAQKAAKAKAAAAKVVGLNSVVQGIVGTRVQNASTGVAPGTTIESARANSDSVLTTSASGDRSVNDVSVTLSNGSHNIVTATRSSDGTSGWTTSCSNAQHSSLLYC